VGLDLPELSNFECGLSRCSQHKLAIIVIRRNQLAPVNHPPKRRRCIQTDIHRMTRLSGLILPPCTAIGKPGPSSLGLLGSQVGDGSTFRARNVDFAFIRTHLSLAFVPARG
jgi:hypothetical protein